MKFIAFILLGIGFLTVFLANIIVKKFNLHKDVLVNFESDLSDEELETYKLNKAIVNFKMLGMLIALPGIIMLFILFKY